MSSARSLNSSGMGSGFASGTGYGTSGLGTSGLGAWNGGWYYNPYFDMFTFVPMAGTLWSPFGYGFFSPLSIYNYYTPGMYWYGGGGPVGAAVTGRPLSGLSAATTKPVPLGRLFGTAGGNTASSFPLAGGSLLAATRSAPAMSAAPRVSSSSGGARSGGHR